MSWKDVLSVDAKNLVEEIDNIKITRYNWFEKKWRRFLGSKLQASEVKSLKDKGEKDRDFIQKYADTELASTGTDITISAYFIALVALIVSGIALIISNPLLINALPQNNLNRIYLAILFLGFFISLSAIIIFCIIHLYVNPKLGRYKAIIMAMEDVKLKNQQKKSLDTIELGEKYSAVDMEYPKNQGSFMQNVKVFDINNKAMSERKLKFVKILLIVGGIVGGIRIDHQNTIMNALFGGFILCAMLYYIIVSNKFNSNDVHFVLCGSTIGIASGFSAIAILPFIYEGLPFVTYVMATILGVLLFILIVWALLVGDGKTAE